MPLFGKIIAAVACLALPLIASAELAFEQTLIAYTSKPGEQFYECVFAFKNTGEEPVLIDDVEPDCGCTTVDFEAGEIAPGASGTIPVHFDFGARVGEQTKHIRVRTANGKNRTYKLELVVNIVPLLLVPSHTLSWKADEPLDAKSITLQLNDHANYRFAGQDYKVRGFTVQFAEGEAGAATFTVTPQARGRRVGKLKLLIESLSDPTEKTVETFLLFVE